MKEELLKKAHSLSHVNSSLLKVFVYLKEVESTKRMMMMMGATTTKQQHQKHRCSWLKEKNRSKNRPTFSKQKQKKASSSSQSVLKTNSPPPAEEEEKRSSITKAKNSKDAFKLETNEIALYDTTLRDGAQQVGMSLTLDDKLAVSKRLKNRRSIHRRRVPWINPKDAEIFRSRSEQRARNVLAIQLWIE